MANWCKMNHMKHREWFGLTTNGDSLRRVEERTGLQRSTITRQLDRDELDANHVIAIAREYGVNPVHALADTGHLTHEEAHILPFRDEMVSDQQLIRTLALRIDNNPGAWEGTFDEVIESPFLHAVADESPEEGGGYPDDYEP